MKNYLNFVLITSFFICACNYSSDGPSQNYDRLKKIPFSEMNNLEKDFFTNTLINRLSSDENFKKMNDLINNQGEILMSNKSIEWSSKFKSERPLILDKKKSENYYNSIGIKNAKIYRENQIRILTYSLIIAKFYPEMKQLSKSKKTEIFKTTILKLQKN